MRIFPYAAIAGRDELSPAIPDPPPPPTLGFTADVTVGVGQLVVTFTGTSTIPLETWLWRVSDDSSPIVDFTAGQQIHTVTLTNSGAATKTYTVTVWGIGDYDGALAEFTRTSYVTLSPAVSVGGTVSVSPTSGYSPLPVVIASALSGSVATVDVYVSNGATYQKTGATWDPFTVILVGAGAYTIRVVVTSVTGSTTEGTTTISVDAVTGTGIVGPIGAPTPLTTALFAMNGSTVPLTNHVVQGVVHFAESDNALTTTPLRVVTAAGTEIASQFHVISRWHSLVSGAGAIKAAIVWTRQTVPARGVSSFLVQRNNTVAATTGSLTLTDTGALYRVSTGLHSWEIGKTAVGISKATIDGVVVQSSAFTLDVALHSGSVSPSSVSTSVEIQGGLVVQIVQRCALGDQAATIRYRFTDASKDVEVTYRAENPKVYGMVANFNNTGTSWREREYLQIPIPNAGSFQIRGPSGLSSVTTSQTYRLLQVVDAPTWYGDRQFEVIDGNTVKTMRHKCRYTDGIDGGTIATGARFEGAVGIAGNLGGVAVCLEDGWQRSPTSVEVKTGTVRIGIFPEDRPSGDHWKPWDYRGIYETQFLSGQSACMPSGYANLDYAPAGYPTSPAPSGTCANPTPARAVDTNSQTMYRFEGGTWRTLRIVLRYFSGPVPGAVELTDFAAVVQRPPLSVCEPKTIEDAETLRAVTWSRTPTAWTNGDLAQWAKFYRGLITDQACDLTQPGLVTTQYRFGWPAHMLENGRQDKAALSTYGYPYYHMGRWSSGYDANHYAVPSFVALAALNWGDYDGLRFARSMQLTTVDNVRNHSRVVGDHARGCSKYETGNWPGAGGQEPDGAHTWIEDEQSLYMLWGDLAAGESMQDSLHYVTLDSELGGTRAAFAWKGRYQERVWAFPQRIACILYDTLGPLANPHVSPYSTILDVIRAGMERYIGLEQGTVLDWRGQHANYVTAANMLSGVAQTFDGIGTVLDTSTYMSAVNHSRPWMHAKAVAAVTLSMSVDPSYDRTVAPWSGWFALLGRMKDRWQNGFLILNSGQAANLYDRWTPPGANTATITNLGVGLVVGNLTQSWYAVMALTELYVATKGTPLEDSTLLDTAERIMRNVRCHQSGNYTTPPAAALIDLPATSSSVYNQTTLAPQTSQHPKHFFWIEAGGDELGKEIGGALIPGPLALLKALRLAGRIT